MSLALLTLLTTLVDGLVVGTATYRERIALPPDAVFVAVLERDLRGSRQVVTEVRRTLGGKQVPLDFSLPYSVEPSPTARYEVRAEIRGKDGVLFLTPEPRPVRLGTKDRISLMLVRASTSVVGVTWTLTWLEGKTVSASQGSPTLTLADDGTLRGFGGVNQFGGTYHWAAPQIQIDPGATTLMAGPPEAMETEAAYLRMLPLANRMGLFRGNLVLRRGDKELARFTKRS